MQTKRETFMRFRQQSDLKMHHLLYLQFNSQIYTRISQGLQLDQLSHSHVEPTLVSIWRCSVNNGRTSILSHWSHATDSTWHPQSKTCSRDDDRLSMYSFGEMSLTWTTSWPGNVTWRASLFETVSSSTLNAKVGHPRSAIYCVTIPPLNTLALCCPSQHSHKTMCPAVFAPRFLSPCILHVFPSKPFALWMGHVSLQWRTA